ncbi:MULTISPECIES: sugar ABC transporter substrate-binding protein [unclassified Microbacterium]|uniref:ABC transporter substrate-binding protein n=1 Tax=unclassified Microbacterium TaxID=2609290 RepID=UPI000EA9DBE6|nr:MULTISPECIES: sugar ABC transporter substrate-binding protein [unclassified Microbacterium]MBT2483651.1 sugar ABC transporter substrate-binding protein [Microbacterium sp. ISL-108]RKN66653.1 sugar ABC transporter substrate-binding protein [Microbacterium sp. CGR2]
MHTTRRRAFRRTVTALAATALLAAPLAACASGAGAEGQGEPITGEGVDDGTTLTLWTRAPIERQANLLVDAYNASHENQVELTVVPNDDYVAKVGAAAGSGGLPDLFAADIVYVPNWAQQGLFADISEQIDGLDYKDEINQGHLAAGTVDDKEYVLPFALDLSMLFWNKELFAEAGLDPEKAPATLDEFADAAKAVQALNKPDTYGTATGLNCGGCLVFTWFPSVWASGEEVMNEDGTEALLAGDAAQEVYDTWADLQESGAVLPSSTDEAGPTWTAAFSEGKVGVMPFPATLLPSIEFDAGVAGIPGVDGGVSTFVGGDGIGISKDSEKAAQAWNFLDWMMSEEAQVEVLAKDGNAVSRGDLADNEYAAEDPRLVTINEVAAEGSTPVALNFQQAFNAPGSPWLTLIRNQVLDGEDTADADNDEITAILSQ